MIRAANKRDVQKLTGQIDGPQTVILALNGEGPYEDFAQYASILTLRAVHRVGGVRGPKDYSPWRHSSAAADAIMDVNLEVSRKRSERHLSQQVLA